MTPDEQEARSRLYSDDRIIILPLVSGRIAVFNNAGELCGIVEDPLEALLCWREPPKTKKIPFTLEDLGL